MGTPDATASRPRRLQAALWYLVPAVLVGVLLHGLVRPRIAGDGYGYYAPVASALLQGNLDLRDEIAPVGPALLRAMFLTPDGRLGDPFPIGPAILWTPALGLAKLLPASSHAGGGGVTRIAHPAFAPRFARALLATDVVLVLGGGTLLAIVLAAAIAPWIAGLAVLAVVIGTPAIFYTVAEPSYGHAAAFAVVAVLVAAVLADRRRRLPLPVLGLSWGLVALVRWQDAVLGLLLAPRLLEDWAAGRGVASRRIGVVLRFGIPALLVFTPQLLFWWRIYGTPLLRPPGAEFVPLWRPQIGPLLFSTWNGAFVWSPVLAFGLLGWWLQPDRRLRVAGLAAIVLEIYVCALVQDWWGGGSIGCRRLVSLAPVAAAGLAWLGERVRQRCATSPVTPRSRIVAGLVSVAVVVACTWNLRLGQHQMRGLLPLNPGNAADYVRWYAPGAPQARRYGLWDYPRLLSDVAAAERMCRIRRHT